MRRPRWVGLPPAVAAGRPGGPAAPRPPSPPPPPALFVTARLPVCGLPTPAHFPGREAAEGREFLGDAPTRWAPPPASPNPAPGLETSARPGPRPREAGVAGGPAGGTAGSPLLGTRGRCAASRAAHGWGPRSPAGARGQPISVLGPDGTHPGRVGGHEFSFRRCGVELPTSPDPEGVSRRELNAMPSQIRLSVSREARLFSVQPAPPTTSPQSSVLQPPPRAGTLNARE